VIYSRDYQAAALEDWALVWVVVAAVTETTDIRENSRRRHPS
jgi:hypothetical protein